MPSKTLKRGSRRQVWNGSAEMTAGGLKKEDLDRNKRGRIVSKKKTSRMSAVYNDSDEEPKEESKKEEPKAEPKKKGGFWESLFE
jgi:hypothetical protein